MSVPTRVFLFGTLRWKEKLRAVLGRATVKTVPAVAEGFGVVWDAAERFPVLADDPDGRLDGIVYEASAEDLKRLDWYEGAFGYSRRTITLPDGPAEVYRLDHIAPGDTPWDYDDWLARDGAMSTEAAAEAMRLYPATPASDMGRMHPMLMARAASKLRAQAAPGGAATRAGAGRKGVTLTGLKPRHRGFFALDEMDLTHRRFDGGTQKINREVFLSTDATLVLPYDPKRDLVVLVEQFRAGPFRRGDPMPWCLEPVAGLIDPGETPEDCAHREAMEEAGLTFSSLQPVPGGYPSPGATAEFYHLFVGLADLGAYRPTTGGLATEGEDILTHVISLDAALGLLSGGEATVLPLAYLLTWTAAHRETLKAH
ncbi:MAG: NUDIX domain-containing protein [Pseudomonadota bacterium]